MTEKQMVYLYLYGTVRQLETVITLTDLAKGIKTRNSKERDMCDEKEKKCRRNKICNERYMVTFEYGIPCRSNDSLEVFPMPADI